MAAFLVAVASGSKIDEGPTQVEQMLQLVDKYEGLEIPAGCKPSPRTPSLRTVSSVLVVPSRASTLFGTDSLSFDTLGRPHWSYWIPRILHPRSPPRSTRRRQGLRSRSSEIRLGREGSSSRIALDPTTRQPSLERRKPTRLPRLGSLSGSTWTQGGGLRGDQGFGDDDPAQRLV